MLNGGTAPTTALGSTAVDARARGALDLRRRCGGGWRGAGAWRGDNAHAVRSCGRCCVDNDGRRCPTLARVAALGTRTARARARSCPRARTRGGDRLGRRRRRGAGCSLSRAGTRDGSRGARVVVFVTAGTAEALSLELGQVEDDWPASARAVRQVGLEHPVTGGLELGEECDAPPGGPGFAAFGVVAVEVSNDTAIVWFTGLQVPLGYPIPAGHVLGRHVVREGGGTAWERASLGGFCGGTGGSHGCGGSRHSRRDISLDISRALARGSSGVPTSPVHCVAIHRDVGGGRAPPLNSMRRARNTWSRLRERRLLSRLLLSLLVSGLNLLGRRARGLLWRGTVALLGSGAMRSAARATLSCRGNAVKRPCCVGSGRRRCLRTRRRAELCCYDA